MQQPQYGMQPAQPQYGANPNYGMQPVQNGYSNQPEYGAPQQQAQYGMQPTPNQGYGAPPQQQQGYQQQQNNPYAAPQQQNNPYAAPPPDTAVEVGGGTAQDEFEENSDKEIYKENEEWVFTPKWDDAAELKLKTACCCCNCAFDDCEDVMQIQCEAVCLCLASAVSWKLFQCQDQANRACCLNTQKVAMCDFTNDDPDTMCSFMFCGVKGIFCLCCSGQAFESICDPCMMPETCCKQLCQMFCIHLRVALPCDENEVPFEIGCCGFMCKEAEAIPEQ